MEDTLDAVSILSFPYSLERLLPSLTIVFNNSERSSIWFALMDRHTMVPFVVEE